jgi:hypothetical protein
MGILRVTGIKGEFTSPPPAVNYIHTNVANDLVVLTFGFVDSSSLSVKEGEEQTPIDVQAQAFERIAVPRSAFAGWLGQVARLISGLPDRETFGWDEFSKVVTEANSAPAKK